MSAELHPRELRRLIRDRKWTGPTIGASKGYIQANLVMMPREQAFNFLLFCVRNPKPCPLLDVLEPGGFEPTIAPGADLRTDLPRYRIFENGRFTAEVGMDPQSDCQRGRRRRPVERASGHYDGAARHRQAAL